jgi:hypothetical protein
MPQSLLVHQTRDGLVTPGVDRLLEGAEDEIGGERCGHGHPTMRRAQRSITKAA